MDSAQAQQLLGRLLAGYPGRDMPDSSVALFASELMAWSWEEGWDAVERAWGLSPRWLPSVGELRECLRGARAALTPALPPEHDALCAHVEAGEPMCERCRRNVEELWASVRERWGGEPFAAPPEVERATGTEGERLTLHELERRYTPRAYGARKRGADRPNPEAIGL